MLRVSGHLPSKNNIKNMFQGFTNCALS